MIDHKCHYGCGNDAIMQNKSGNWMCNSSANKCPANRKRNSDRIKKLHIDGVILGWNDLEQNGKGNRNWKKGLNKSDPRVAANALAVSTTMKGKPGRLHSDESKMKMSAARLVVIAEGRHDSSGRKGHRGFYDGIYFHSSWELAYYIYQKEINGVIISRNTRKIPYYYGECIKHTIPDFIHPTDGLIEIKGYLFSERDTAKFEQTSYEVKYLFKQDIDMCLKYCTSIYGSKFWDKLYA